MSKMISDSKLQHMKAVAELMYERALIETSDEAYAEDMFVLGLLHDIGYLFGSDEHGKSGAALMERNGYIYSNEILHHGKFDIPESESTPELELLQWCDMSVLPGGKKVSCSERLEDVGRRYGFDSRTYAVCRDICERLAGRGRF